MSDLTPKQKAFVLEYTKDLNATQAAIRAGYSKKGVKTQASQLLSNVNVQKELSIAVEKRNNETKIDAAYVLNRLRQIDEMDALDILDDDGFVRPLSQWPLIWRQFISGFEVTEAFFGVDPSKRGPKPKGQRDAKLVGMIKKVKWPDKVKNLELIGRHVNVMAFRENLSLTGKDGKDLAPTVIFLPPKEKI